jgi:hypothetical protein
MPSEPVLAAGCHFLNQAVGEAGLLLTGQAGLSGRADYYPGLVHKTLGQRDPARWPGTN